MKKLLACIITLLVLCPLSAFALKGTGYPASDGTTPVTDQLCGRFGTDELLLSFDASSDYSSYTNGEIKACFFAYDSSAQYYTEFYLTLPDTIKAGDLLTESSIFENLGSMVSLNLYEVGSDGKEDAWYSMNTYGLAYPTGCSFTISIEYAEISSASIHVTGTLSATMIYWDGGDVFGDSLSISDVHFDFTLPVNGRANSFSQDTPGQSEYGNQAPMLPESASSAKSAKV